PPAAVPSPVATLRAPEEVDRGPHRRMLEAVAEGAQELEPPPGEVFRGRIQQGPVVGEGDVIEDEAVVVGVEGSPAAVRALHAEKPGQAARAREAEALGLETLELLEWQQHHRGVVEVRIE